MKFDDALKAALHAMEFDIAADGKTATLRGEMTVEFTMPDRDALSLTVTLPYGMRFGKELSRDYLMDKAADFVEFRPDYS